MKLFKKPRMSWTPKTVKGATDVDYVVKIPAAEIIFDKQADARALRDALMKSRNNLEPVVIKRSYDDGFLIGEEPR